MEYLLYATIWIVSLPTFLTGCGTSTHIHIAHESLQFFRNSASYSVNYLELLRIHQDAFIAGNPYPDAMYPSLCFGGKYHNIAEDTHWAPFLNASINYIRDHLQRPWDEETQKLVAFVFGFVSHQVADVSWHSLGIDQGFLRTMSYMNFHSNYGAAHSTGDAGGDMVSQLEGDDDPISTMKWYIPSKDLEKIYTSYYGDYSISHTVIEDCSMLLYIEWLAEKLGGAKLFPYFAQKSPFLVEQLHGYYLGGIHDMAGWTTLLWNTTAFMIEDGTDVCTIVKNPLFVTCRGKDPAVNIMQKRQFKNPGKVHVFMGDLKPSDVTTTKTERGIYFHPTPQLLHKLKEKSARRTKLELHTPFSFENMTSSSGNIHHGQVLTTRSLYSEVGRSFVTWKTPSNENLLVVGAPYAGSSGNPSIGKIYLLPESLLAVRYIQDIMEYVEDVAVKVFEGKAKMERFGTSMVVLDFNQDGVDDLVVGAPSSGAEELTYLGAVYIYFGRKDIKDRPDVVIQGTEKYDNFGYSLNTCDYDGDGFSDLIVSSPFAPGGGQQRGSAYIYLSKHGMHPGTILKSIDAFAVMTGRHNYEWFGYSMTTTVVNGLQLIVIGSPGSRNCAKANCDFDDKDVQEIGRVYIYGNHSTAGPTLLTTINGTTEFSKLGFSLAAGDPHGTGFKSVLAVGSPSSNVKGHVSELVPVTFTQAGRVVLYDLQSLVDARKGDNSWNMRPIANFDGDRSYGRFGWTVNFEHFSSEKYDDLFIGHPYRSKDITGEVYGGEEGAFYSFEGGPNFPTGDVTTDCGLLSVSPCPSGKATFSVFGKEAKGRFGTNLAVLPFGPKGKNVLVGAPRSGLGAFHGGSVLTFSK